MTASREKLPRAITSHLPSGDQAWRQIYIDVKFVGCLVLKRLLAKYQATMSGEDKDVRT